MMAISVARHTWPPQRAEPRADSLERELKHLLPQHASVHALAWLSNICTPDPNYPAGLVTSIYYDTRSLRLLGEKINSDYLKTKIRIRWYAKPDGDCGGAPVFVEAKNRFGVLRDKVRRRLEVPADWVAALPLHDPALRDLPRLLHTHGVPADPAMVPIFTVRYQRTRFVEPWSGARINLDTDIGVSKVNREVLSRTAPVWLDTSIVEVKTGDSELPRTLRPLLYLGARKAAISKYSACFQRVMSVEL